VVRVPAVPVPGYPSFRLWLPSHRVRNALMEHQAEIVHLASPVFLGAHGAAVALAVREWLAADGQDRDITPESAPT
jgi:hypothetical protein